MPERAFLFIMTGMFDPKSSSTMGYHLFLIPPEKERLELQAIITSLATGYDSISFEPHITLLARIEESDEKHLLELTKCLAKEHEPISVVLEGVGIEDAYYRALYYRVRENNALMSMHEHAIGLFKTSASAPYMPHLSLYYGNLPTLHKEAMSSALVPQKSFNFEIDSVHLYRTSGEPHQWVRIGEFKLGTSA